MALLTALAAAYGGYGQGRQQAVQNKLAQQQEADYQAQTEIEKQRAQQEQQKFNVEQQQAGYDPVTGKLLPLSAKGYVAISPGDDEATISKKSWQNYAIATQQGDAAGIARWGGFVGKGTPSQAYQQVTGGNVNVAKVKLIDAQAAAERDLPARARQIAAGHNAAQIQAAGMRYRSAIQVAGMNDQTKIAVANLAGAYRLQGVNDQDSVRMAIADYQGQVSMYNSRNRDIAAQNDALLRAEATAKSPLGYPQGWDPGATFGAPPAMGAVNINIGQPTGTPYLPPPPGYGGNGAPNFPPITRPKGEAGKIDTGDYAPKKVLQDAWEAMQHGASPQKIAHLLQTFVNEGKISPQVATSIEQMLHTGGSQAAGNPPLPLGVRP
jgi:hypothetical protein